MPIQSLISQPGVDSLNASYRPIKFKISATKTDNSPIPPIVYCDIYINGIYYRSISRTSYSKLLVDRTEWDFDVQDVAQEYLGKFIGANGGSNIVEATPLVAFIQVKFRSSGVNSDGFTIVEGTSPVQATNSSPAVSGTGTQSNIFWIVNTVLQHWDNQDLVSHLNAFKTGTWGTTSYPLTHRPTGYYICKEDSDYFPILTNKIPDHIVLNYRLKDETQWRTASTASTCIPVSSASHSLPNGHVGVPYSAQFDLLGTLPITVDTFVKPAWMSIAISGRTVTLSGTPTANLTNSTVSFTAHNCASSNTSLVDHITVDTPPCVGITFNPGVSFPNGAVGVPYNYTITTEGSLPMSLSSVIKPSWMTLTIVGSEIRATGTPDVASSSVDISFTVTNCNGPVNVFNGIIVLSNANNRVVFVKYANDTTTVCSMSSSFVAYTDNGILTAGSVLYYDQAGTSRITGYSYVKDATISGDIYNLNSATGTLLSSTGIIC